MGKKTKIVSKMVDQTQEALDEMKDDGSDESESESDGGSNPVVPVPNPMGIEQETDCSGRDKAEKGDKIWCACNIKKEHISLKDDCENPGGGRADVCEFMPPSSRKGIPKCVPKSKPEGGEEAPMKIEVESMDECRLQGTGFCDTSIPCFPRGAKRITLKPRNPKGKTIKERCCPVTKCVDDEPKTPEEVKEKALPPGTTCMHKRPVKDLRTETNMITLYAKCSIHAKREGVPMFVLYPPEAKEARSNCWVCKTEETRPSKMSKAFLFKTKGGDDKPEGGGDTTGCTKKGFMPCGSGRRGKPVMKVIGGVKHCCPKPASAEEEEAPSDGKKCCKLPGIRKAALYGKCPPQGKEVPRVECGKKRMLRRSKAMFLETSEH